jgi:hypothetical protein
MVRGKLMSAWETETPYPGHLTGAMVATRAAASLDEFPCIRGPTRALGSIRSMVGLG